MSLNESNKLLLYVCGNVISFTVSLLVVLVHKEFHLAFSTHTRVKLSVPLAAATEIELSWASAAMATKSYDYVIFGASGFTGQFVVQGGGDPTSLTQN